MSACRCDEPDEGNICVESTDAHTLRRGCPSSSAAMMSRNGESYHPETHVIDLAELTADYLRDAAGNGEGRKLRAVCKLLRAAMDGLTWNRALAALSLWYRNQTRAGR